MIIRLTRDSVATGDDVMAPHEKMLTLPEESGLDDFLKTIIGVHYLASIAGGKATWSVFSSESLAVIAQQWEGYKIIPNAQKELSSLNWVDGVLQVHCKYHRQNDPQIVYEMLC